MTASGDLDEADKAAVAEIIALAKDQKIYRVKMHDKPSALALLLQESSPGRNVIGAELTRPRSEWL